MIVALLACAASGTARAGDIPPHPRLLLTPAAEARLREHCAADPVLAMVRDVTIAAADKALTTRTCEHRIPDGKRLLGESRHAIAMVLATGMAWRLTDEQPYFDRCVKELDAACSLPDWNPAHFLDVAEMATAVALGLDWLHAGLSKEQRARYCEALEAKAIGPAREQLQKQPSWTRVHNNWAQVCGAGIVLACAAVSDDDAAREATPFADCLRIVEASSRFYEPDGGYPEGPTYWDYGTAYHVLGLAVADGLGRKLEPPQALLDGAAFMAHASGPTGRFFNFADANPNVDPLTAARSWLIARAGNAALASHLRSSLWKRREEFAKRPAGDRFFPLHLLWLPPAPPAPPALPLAAVFRGEQPVAMMRSAWDDTDAVFVAAKGGTPAASHGHMDVGSFIVEMLGHRWIHDLGPDDYNLPGYFAGARWDYFRLNARSHNVLLIGDGMQNPRAEPCRLVASHLDTPPFAARFDLTSAYAFGESPLAGSVDRQITLDPDSKTVRIRDTITAPRGQIRWQCVVDVEPTLSGNRARLNRGGKSVEVVVDGADTAWQVEPARPPTAEERNNEGFRLLFCTLPPRDEVTIDVTIAPQEEGPRPVLPAR